MVDRLRGWLDERRRRRRLRVDARKRSDLAMSRALLQEFQRIHQRDAMGAHVLRSDPDQVIVRVTYMTNHVPPDRAWYAVPSNGDPVRALSYEDVETIEGPWR